MVSYIMNKPASLVAVASLSLLAFAAGCSSAGDENVDQSEGHIEASVVVYDHNAPQALLAVEEAESKRVIAKLFPAGTKLVEECVDMETPALIPGVDGKLTGSFTSGGRNETLYVVTVWDCQLGHADGNGTTKFVVTEPLKPSGDVKILANAEVQGVGTGVNRMLDLDKDGQNELVITYGYTGQGITMETPSLVRFAGSNLAADPKFADLENKLRETDPNAESPFFQDNCNSGLQDIALQISFTNVRATFSNGSLAFTSQRGTLSCPPEENQ